MSVLARPAALTIVASRAWALGACVLVASACKSSSSPPGSGPDPRESPQASAQPTPLALPPPTTTASSSLVLSPEAGPPPTPLRADERLGNDGSSRDTVSFTLSAALRPADVVGPPRAPEVNAQGLEAARKKTELRLGIDLTSSRMRATLLGSGFVLPPETELRARADRYGHVVVWPGGGTYSTLAPGAMRALLGERRFDVAPLSGAEIAPRDESGKRIGVRVRKVDVTTRAAKATFEIGKLEGSGEGGVLMCRFLLDLIGAPPSSPVCTTDEVPMRVEMRWVGSGSLAFEVTGLMQRKEPVALLVPPTGAVLVSGPPPGPPVQSLLAPPELAALRTASPEPPGPHEGALPSTSMASDEIAVSNPTLQLRLLWVDGVPVAWAAPGGRDVIAGLHRGRYVAQWRTFLGDALETPFTIQVPGAAQVGAGPGSSVDAGAR